MKTTVIVLTTVYFVYLAMYAIKKSLRIARIKRTKDMQKAKKMLRMGIRYSKVIEPPFKWKSWSAWRKYVEAEHHEANKNKKHKFLAKDNKLITNDSTILFSTSSYEPYPGDQNMIERKHEWYLKKNRYSNKDVFEIARRLATKRFK